MSTENATGKSTKADDPANGKVKVDEGSAPYPFYVIEDALPRTKQIAEHFGIDSPPAKRKDVCLVLGKAEPTLMPYFGTGFQYGLLENVPAKGIVVKELYQKIAAPIYGEEGKRAAMIEAFANPPLYKKLIQEYNNKILPNETGLANLLATKEYGIHSNSTARAAKIFFENGKSLDIIDNNNRLRYIVPNNVNGAKADPVENDSESTKQKKNNNFQSQDTDDEMFELPIDLGTNTAYLRYPRKIDSSEIAILKIMLDATLTALQARQKQVEVKNKGAETPL